MNPPAHINALLAGLLPLSADDALALAEALVAHARPGPLAPVLMEAARHDDGPCFLMATWAPDFGGTVTVERCMRGRDWLGIAIKAAEALMQDHGMDGGYNLRGLASLDLADNDERRPLMRDY